MQREGDRSEGVPDVGDGVFVFKKPWATRPDVERISEGNLDVGEVGVG